MKERYQKRHRLELRRFFDFPKNRMLFLEIRCFLQLSFLIMLDIIEVFAHNLKEDCFLPLLMESCKYAVIDVWKGLI